MKVIGQIVPRLMPVKHGEILTIDEVGTAKTERMRRRKKEQKGW